MDPQLTTDQSTEQAVDQKSSHTLVIVILVVLVAVAYVLWPHTSNVPVVTPTATSTVQETTPALPQAQAPSQNPVTPTNPATLAPHPATVPPTSKDSVSTSVNEGTIPFSTDFTLTLNTSRNCSTVTYVLDYGDNIKKEVQVPTTQCGKVYATTLNHQYQRAGDFTATLSTKPMTGPEVMLSHISITAKNPSVTIGNKAASFTLSPTAGNSPLMVGITLSAGDSTDSTVRYTAVFGDGQSTPFTQTASPSLTHVYTSSGVFVLNVTKQTGCTATQCSGSTSPVGTITINVN